MIIHLDDDQSTVLADAERAPLMSSRSRRWADQRVWISTRIPATLEHDAHTVARCVRDGLLGVTAGYTLALTDHGRDALNRYRFERRPVEIAA